MFVIILLLCPVVFYISAEGSSIVVRMRYLFIKKQLYPTIKKDSEKNDTDETDTDQQGSGYEYKGKEKKNLSFEQVLNLVQAVFQVLPPTGRALRYFLKQTKIRKLKAVFVYGNEDAAVTGIRYGQLQTAVLGAYQLIDTMTNLSAESITVTPVFGQEVLTCEIDGKISIRPMVLLGVLRRVVIPYGKLILTIIKKDGAENERTSDKRTGTDSH